MTAITIESMTAQTAIAALNLYQKYLSPRKGFACPHRLLHNDGSCSDYVKNLLIKQDLRTALKMAPLRFQACQKAAQTLRSQTASSGCIVIPCCLPF